MDTAARPTPLRRLHDRALAGTPVRGRWVRTAAGERVHVLESGDGPPLVILHGTASSALFLLPLLKHLKGTSSIAVDRPGQGMSDAVDLPPERYRASAVGWIDRVLDTLGLDTAAVLGHSMGGRWAMWYALANPDRVSRLALVGVPGLPGTRCPLPLRLIATPGVGELIQRQPASPASVVRFARFMGEGDSIVAHPDLIDLMVTARPGRVDTAEARALISPLALLSPYGWRRGMRVAVDELRQLAVPTLLLWGQHDPVGSVAVARSVTERIPGARLEVLPGGHAPWLGHPERMAAMVTDFVAQREHI